MDCLFRVILDFTPRFVLFLILPLLSSEKLNKVWIIVWGVISFALVLFYYFLINSNVVRETFVGLYKPLSGCPFVLYDFSVFAKMHYCRGGGLWLFVDPIFLVFYVFYAIPFAFKLILGSPLTK